MFFYWSKTFFIANFTKLCGKFTVSIQIYCKIMNRIV